MKPIINRLTKILVEHPTLPPSTRAAIGETITQLQQQADALDRLHTLIVDASDANLGEVVGESLFQAEVVVLDALARMDQVNLSEVA